MRQRCTKDIFNNQIQLKIHIFLVRNSRSTVKNFNDRLFLNTACFKLDTSRLKLQIIERFTNREQKKDKN